jgi:positive regulator of sigma E activity
VKPVRQFYLLCLFVLVGLVAFSTVLNSYFLSDDFVLIGNILGGRVSPTLAISQGGFFRPIVILSYIVEVSVWGIRPLGFHLTNVTFHALNAYLTYILSFRLVQDLNLSQRKKHLISLAAGFLFLLHPSHTETVSWISGRFDVIATFFCLASLISFAAYEKNRRVLHLALSLLAFALALLSKESAICLPFLLLVIGLAARDGGRDKESVKRLLKVIALFALILLVFVAVRSAFIGALVGGYGAAEHLNFAPGWLRVRLLQASLRSILPALPSQWSLFLLKPLQSLTFGIIALVFSAIVAISITTRRQMYGRVERRQQNRFLLALLLMFLFSLLPVINLRLSLYDTQGERFVYLPTIFACLALAYLSAILFRNTRVWLIILICWLGFYTAALYHTNQRWRDAAQVSRTVLDDLAGSATHDRILIINTPDNLDGVHLYRNGLPEALMYFQHQKVFKQVETVAFQNFQTGDDEVRTISDGTLLTVNSVINQDTFWRVASTECVEIISHTATSLQLKREVCLANADVFVFSKGRMSRLE